MANTRMVTAIVAAGVAVAGFSAAAAWAGGPGGVVEASNNDELWVAVGTGTYNDSLGGFQADGATLEEASAAVLAQCQATGAQDCTVDEYTNDNLCIVSVADAVSDVVAGGAGPTLEAAKADALARAAANGTPEDPAGATIIASVCP